MMFTGTNQQQDTRFSDKEKKLLKQMKFGDCLNKRVDMSKVKLDVLRPWISKKITDILHIEDDVVVEFVYNQLEEEKYPCPKKMQINMTGFLNGKNARQFMGELWALLLSAQDSDSGIPAEFIQQKKDEILKREEEQRQEQGKRDRSRSPFGKDRDRDVDRDKERSNRKDRSGRERSKEHSIVRDLPASTLNAIEQVRSQLSTNSRSSSTEKINLSNTKFKNSSENVRNRSKSPNQKSDYATKSRIRSRSRERRRSRDRSTQRVSRERNSSPIRRRSSRDRDRRRSRSPRRRSIDRKRRNSRSRDRSGRQPNHRRSRSNSPPNRNDKPKLITSRRSLDRRSKSKSPENRKKSPKPESRNYSSSPNATKSGINGIDNASKISEKKLTKVQGKLFDLASGNKRNSSTSRSRSKSIPKSPVPSEHKRNDTKSRSRSLPKRNTRAKSSSSRTSSSSRSSVRLDPKRKIQRSLSRDSRSASASPDNRRSDFEIQKSKNSVQKKRHYRNNRDSSSGSSVERTTDERIGEKRREGYRRQSPRGKSPNFRNQRSRSRRRSRTRSRSRSRIRNRSRSPIRRSRSPRRFNRRWSPSFHHYRGRGVMNRSRANNWRRSRSRGRGGGGGGRNMSPQRRFSPPRRYSRDRRSPALQAQQRDRKFSPVRRHSPPPLQRRSRERRQSPRDRRPSSRDRRQSSPLREFSRERRTSRERRRSSPPFTDFGGRMKQRNENRWDTQRNEKPLGAVPKAKQRVSSESSNWEEDDQPDPVPVTNKESPKKQISAPTSNISPIKNSGGRREKSKSLSQERNKTAPSPIVRETAVKNKLHPAEYSSLERSDPQKEKIMPVSSRNEKDDSKRKTKSEGPIEIAAKQQQIVIEEQVLAPSKDKANKEISRSNYSSSLSRTPSPFLKPHEREKTSQVLITQRKQFDKKPAVVAKTINTNDSDSSSSDSSMYSSENDEEESVRNTSKKKNEKKVARSSDSERSIDDKKVPTKGKRIGLKDTSRGNKSSHKNSSDIKEKFDQPSKANRLDVSASASSDLMDRSMPSSDSKNPFKSGLERRHVMSTTDSEEDRKSKHTNANASGHKRTLSTSGLKKQDSDSSDSDYDQTSKKKRKKNKKMAKRNSDIDSSDSEAEAKKKKHKKHKKHSKKNKKHKKHKKKSKKAETSSSDDDTDSKPSKIQTIKGRFPAGINEDLEKQLRERALKSMKKID